MAFFGFGSVALRASTANSPVDLPMLGEELTRWTIRLALAACVGRWCIALTARPDSARWRRLARGLWTAGCLLLWVHVACAFHFYHHWSLTVAVAQTARETAEVVGLNWGGGVWLNFLLMLLWAGDVIWWWLAPASHSRRPHAVEWVWQGFFAFIAFNATVVFEWGVLRWAGWGATLTLLMLALIRWRGRTG
jgi:hypothetical protein